MSFMVKTAQIVEIGKVELRDEPYPKLEEGAVLIKTAY
jgi:hypothetical protein